MKVRDCAGVVTTAALGFLLWSGCLGSSGGSETGTPVTPTGSTRVPGGYAQDNSWSGAYASGMKSVVCAGDNVYATWANIESGQWRIYFAKSTDGGRTFLPEIRVDRDPGISRHHPVIGVSASRIYIAWQDDRADGTIRGSGVDFDILLVSSSDGGQTFSAPIIVNDNTDDHQTFPTLAVSPTDSLTVYVAWEDKREGFPTNDIFFGKSTDGGATFGPSLRVNDDNTTMYHFTPALAAGGSGTLHIVWSQEDPAVSDTSTIYADRSTDGGATFGTDVRVNDIVPNSCYDPSITASGSGDVYVSWSDGRAGQFTRDIYLAASRDGGATFQPSVAASVESSPSKQEYSSIAISSSGVLWVAYEDYQRDMGNSGDLWLVDIYVTRSVDGGKSFSTPVRINDPATWGAIAPNLSLKGTGIPVVLWSPVTQTYRDIRLTYY